MDLTFPLIGIALACGAMAVSGVISAVVSCFHDDMWALLEANAALARKNADDVRTAADLVQAMASKGTRGR